MGNHALLASLVLILACSQSRAQEEAPQLVPAGTINDSVAHARQTYVLQDHEIVLEYAVRRIMAYGGTHAYELFTPYLQDGNDHVRLVAVSALSRFPVRKDRKTGRFDPHGTKTANALYAMYLREPSDKVVKVLAVCLRRFHPEATYRDAIVSLQTGSDDENTRARVAKIAEALILKKRVPSLFHALVSTSPRRVAP